MTYNAKNWSVQDAIMSRVERESLMEWAQRPEEKWKIVPPLPPTKINNRGILKVFINQVMP